VQSGTPVAIQNFIQPEAGCNWFGVGGQVFNQEGTPVSGLIVKISGMLEGNQVLIYGITGSSIQLGSGGFDVFLANHPINSESNLYLQLFDTVGASLSFPIKLVTNSNCAQNFLLINLIETTLDIFRYFPIIFKR